MLQSLRFGRGAALLAVLLLLAGGSWSTLSAQSEAVDVTYVELTSVKQVHEGKSHFIEIKAKTPNLPVGCKVMVILSWNYQRIQSHVFTVPSNRRLEERFKIKNYAPSPQHYVIRTQLLEMKDQPRKVSREMERDPKTFPPGAEPWAEQHDEKKFLMGTPEEIEAELKRVRDWFNERWRAIAGLDRKVANAAKAVREGTEYVNGKGEFEDDKWRKMMDDDVLKPIREYQKEIEEGLTGGRADMVAYRSPLADLRELSRAVALRVTKKSIDLYKEKGLSPAAEDSEPEEIVTKVRGFRGKRVPRSADLEKIVKRITTKLAPPKSPEPKEGTP